MPYHNFETPLVNYWFSATKRPLDVCTSNEALDSLVESSGATVLYHYLHRYAEAETGRLSPTFIASIERLADREEVWTEPVSAILDRLKAARLLFLVKSHGRTYLVNAGSSPVSDVQILFDRPNSLLALDPTGRPGCSDVVPELRAREVLPLESALEERVASQETY
ncbi:MAG: hypothetical protein AAEJ65_10340, partial [Planctomycetota bacterium]